MDKALERRRENGSQHWRDQLIFEAGVPVKECGAGTSLPAESV